MTKSEYREFARAIAVASTHAEFAARSLATLHRSTLRAATRAAVDAALVQHNLHAYVRRVGDTWIPA